MKRVLTGIKPSGDLHLGNYFGVVQPLLKLQEDPNNELFVFVANYHAMTSVKDSVLLQENTIKILKLYIAAGLNPEKVTIYLQSDVPQVQELCWMFATLTTMPELMRAHAFKDAEAKSKDINVGTFIYPLLMAADIILMDADAVPVGKDQKQHLEMAREMARDFNSNYLSILKEPQEIIQEDIATIPGTDGNKMSKSHNNTIPIIATEDEWRKAVFSIVTGTEPLGSPLNPDTCNVFALHKLISKDNLIEIERRYKEGSMGYKESKEILLDNLIKEFQPINNRFNEISDKEVLEIIKNGKQKAVSVATQKMSDIKKAVGLSFDSQ